MAHFRPLLIPGREVPFEFERLCHKCKQQSLYIGFGIEFHISCENHFCKNRQKKHYIPCVLKHRNLSKEMFQFTIADQFAYLPSGDPDVENEVFKPTTVAGPYENCGGYLGYDNEQPVSRDTWVICGRCRAAYHVMIMATTGLAGNVLHHNQFRVKPILTNLHKHKQRYQVISKWNEDGLKIPSREILMFCDEIRWFGHRITEAQPMPADMV